MKKLLTALFSFVVSLTYSQKQDYNWCFGDSCGIQFTDSNAVFFTSASSFDTSFSNINLENVASISDNSGNLLFYTNGSLVWNRNHEVMPHGSGLYSNTSVTNGSLIIRQPNDSLVYYLFHLDNLFHLGLFYAEIDMSLDQNLGDIITGKKNIHIFNDLPGEKLSAVKHANGRDWWIVMREDQTNDFYVFLLTPDTIILSSVQTIGTIAWPDDMGEMTFSSSGNRLAVVGKNGIINLFDFDRCTGIFSDFVDLNDGAALYYYGCSFSPDGSKLYVSSFEYLFQFNLNDSRILMSKTLIWDNPYYASYSPNSFCLCQHQITPMGKIFISLARGISQNVPDTFINKSLCVINKPNESGSACDFVPCSFYLDGHHTDFGLPNSPNYNLGALSGSPCDTLSIPTLISKLESSNFNISPNPASSSFNIAYTIHQSAILTIINAYGIAVKQLTLYPNSKNHIVYVDDLPEGIYLVSMYEGNKISSRRIIVER